VIASPGERPGDAGFTLIEMTVGLALMSVMMVIFTSGFIQIVRLNRATAALGDGESQVSRAFRRLDNELRYAADVRAQVLPGSGSTDSSLIYLTTAAAPRCYALSLVNGSLQHREWTPGAAIGAASVLASGVSAVSHQQPFSVSAPAASAGDTDAVTVAAPKSATILLTAAAGGQAYTHERELRAQFVAPNTVQGPRDVSLDDCVPSG
jgi:prepilin-type N-terminal cleavage/methylation domain-containing protein